MTHVKRFSAMLRGTIFSGLLILCIPGAPVRAQNYPVVGTGQTKAYNNTAEITVPDSGQTWYGQSANYPGNQPSYTLNGDGTVTDNITGLMWSQSPDLNLDGEINYSDKLTYYEAVASAGSFSLAGYNDWRLPTIKELYSLIMFSGIDVDPQSTTGSAPFIDTNYFRFAYGDLTAGERIIDAQMASSTLYVSTTMNGQKTMFGVNFADGRIKGYPTDPTSFEPDGKKFYVYYVRGNSQYGQNQFTDNGNGTITDQATGLMWMQNDNGEALSWEEALPYAENFSFAGYSDWRLPSAKELQSIVDYTRSPATTLSAAIDPVFNCTQITDEGGDTNYPFYWAGTTHVNSTETPGESAVYVCFGEALGWMEDPVLPGNYVLMDVHGAGAQRSDFKTGDPAWFPHGHGPQGDVVRIYNYVRLVRNATGSLGINQGGSEDHLRVVPNPANGQVSVRNYDGFSTLLVYNNSGEKISQANFDNPGNEIKVNLPATGIYYFCFSGSGNTVVKKIVNL